MPKITEVIIENRSDLVDALEKEIGELIDLQEKISDSLVPEIVRIEHILPDAIASRINGERLIMYCIVGSRNYAIVLNRYLDTKIPISVYAVTQSIDDARPWNMHSEPYGIERKFLELSEKKPKPGHVFKCYVSIKGNIEAKPTIENKVRLITNMMMYYPRFAKRCKICRQDLVKNGVKSLTCLNNHSDRRISRRNKVLYGLDSQFWMRDNKRKMEFGVKDIRSDPKIIDKLIESAVDNFEFD